MNKKVLLIVLLVPCLLLCAQSYFYVYYSDGRTIQYDSAKADSVNYNSTANEFGVIKGGKAVTSFPATQVDSISAFAADGNMERCTADMYKQVTIGGQVWLAENYRCSKYDTESEAYKNGMYVIPLSETVKTTPYYAPSGDAHPEFGYYYSWAAAVGVENGKSQTEPFDDVRQGVCPNGWHLPTMSEWNTLKTFIEDTDGKGTDTAGKHLKSTSGWNDGGNGLDTYNFTVNPSGFYNNGPDEVGKSSQMWTATPTEGDNGRAVNALLGCTHNKINSGNGLKGLGRTVRCVKIMPNKVTDICGNTYPIVTIGNQVWMAENLRCNKYDTESEAYKDGRYTVSMSATDVYTPYYADASDQSKWTNDSKRWGANLTVAQIAKLGYLYNWAASVGIADGSTQTTDFAKKRQGICPNGWHIPSSADWKIFADYLDGNNGQTDAGKKIKSSSGWYENNTGIDSYGFTTLPAGFADGNVVDNIGSVAYLWSSDLSYLKNFAKQRDVEHRSDVLFDTGRSISLGMSVRCIKDFPEKTFTVAHGRIEKTSTKEKLNRLWQEDDAISMFFDAKGDANPFALKSGAGLNSATFEGTAPVNGDEYVALYPTTVTPSITEASGTHSVNFTMPQQQNVTAAGEINATTLPMLGYTTDTEIAMKNVGSLLELGLKTKEGTANVVKIELQGNDNEKLSGAFAVEVKKDGSQPVAVASGEASDADKTLTVNCGTYESGKYKGIEINSTEFTNFYISIPAEVFAKGFTATVTISGGKVATITTTTDISVEAAKLAEFAQADVEFKLPPSPDCQKALADESNWVTIGTQTWLNVNTRCIEYDTESEAYAAGIASISTSSSSTYDPYYTDPTALPTGKPDYMSDEQWGQLGMLYNFAAAMGYSSEDEAKSQTGDYSGNRQGICPNGWHIPSVAEWNTLRDYLGGQSGAGKKMKTTTGWQTNSGTDEYGFAALPAGYANGSSVSIVGRSATYWSSAAYGSNNAYYRTLGYGSDRLNEYDGDKSGAYSVRCVKTPETVKDACGNKYPVVTIGNQTWMAENMRCNKYDTESERAGVELSTSSSSVYTPYYTDPTTLPAGKPDYMSDEQWGQLGMLYNFAAAMGYSSEDEAKSQTGDYSGNRQGICPNGWHVPSVDEWNTLRDYLGGSNAGRKMRTTTGWQTNTGTDEYGFAALPAGYAYGSSVNNVGRLANYWSSVAFSSNNAYYRYLNYNDARLYEDFGNKNNAYSVRCIKDPLKFTVTHGEIEKTSTKEKLNSLWLTDDAISMFIDAKGSAKPFAIKSGAGSNSATFEGAAPVNGEEYVAFYPTTVTPSITEASGTHSVEFTMPQQQNVTAAGEINATTLPMLGYTTDTEIAMKNVGSLLELGLKTKEGTANVVKIDLQGNDNEKLSGAFAVEVKKDGTQPVAVASGEASDADKTLTVNCGVYESGKYNGIEINSTEFTNFYISIPAGVFAKGFTATVTISGGKVATITTTTDISVEAAKLAEFAQADVEFETTSVTDVCGNTYPVVKIGNQTWMAENMRCNKYDTESEAYNAYWLTNNTIPTTGYYDSYYTTSATEGYGYYYNWAAAVGMKTIDEPETKFSGNHQGICPNGWHVPTAEECKTLINYVEKTEGKDLYFAGKYLKSKSGWNDGGNGEDLYGFSVMPTGYANGSDVSDVGLYADFWTTTQSGQEGGPGAYTMAFVSFTDAVVDSQNRLKNWGYNVRCVMNPPYTGEAERTGGTKVKWVQLWEGGPKFAEYNVGATSVGDYGEYYTWGGSTNKSSTDYAPSSVTTDIQYDSTYDTARKKWGSNWQMPTKEDLQALLDNCDVAWKSKTESGYGVAGRIYTGKGDYSSNSVFFPAVGYCRNGSVSGEGSFGFYWSSTPNGSGSACRLIFSTGDQGVGSNNRGYGYSVRAVLKEN